MTAPIHCSGIDRSTCMHAMPRQVSPLSLEVYCTVYGALSGPDGAVRRISALEEAYFKLSDLRAVRAVASLGADACTGIMVYSQHACMQYTRALRHAGTVSS